MKSLFRRSKTTVGLDVGSGFIKVVAIDHSGAEPEVTHAACIPLTSDAIVEGEVMDPQVVVEAIRSLLETFDTPPKNVVTSVGGRDVIVKRIQMDRMKEADAREVIRWEAEQHVPFDMDNVQLDFQILDPWDDGLQMSVLLVAAKREVVDQKLALLRDAGVSATVVDVDAFALHNALEFNYPEVLDGVVALVSVGHELSTVNILQNGVPVLTRDVPFGSRRLRERLRRVHGLTEAEAVAVVQSESPRQEEYRAALLEGSEELAVGVERAAAFLSADHGGRQTLGRVLVCGGGARVPGVVESLSARLGVRTETANPLQRLRVRPGATSLFPVEDLAPMLMLPAGLALRTV